MSSWNEILVIAILILVNGILAMSEAALVASRKARLQNRVNEGDKASLTALKLIERPNVFLSTIQIGITLIGVLAGALGGATIAETLAVSLAKIPVISEYSESLALGTVVVVITILSLWLGELVPKRLGLHSPEQIARVVASPMLLISRIFSPFISLMSWATDLVIRLIGVEPSLEPPITEEELQVLIDQGTQAGVFEESEQDMVEGIFSLGDSRVYSLMTPRTELVWLDVTDSIEEIRQKIAECPYSRFPVREDSLETILGIVKSRDLLVDSLSGKEIDLRALLKPAYFIPETMFASHALELFKEKNTELLLVVDEFGGLQGLLTINDILEEIVGAMEFEEPQATQRQDGSWLLDGMLEVDEFKELFNFNSLPHEDEYETLSGFVMASLGRMPQAADQFEWSGYRFEVMDMDGRRVDKVQVTTLPKPPVA
ncbi:MAG: HlyC/CorC family transporter [Anaerolineaceae bacterium]|nr:MAG: HlyC/CorC family transporter [Anaerolineaceae bacterium]